MHVDIPSHNSSPYKVLGEKVSADDFREYETAVCLVKAVYTRYAKPKEKWKHCTVETQCRQRTSWARGRFPPLDRVGRNVSVRPDHKILNAVTSTYCTVQIRRSYSGCAGAMDVVCVIGVSAHHLLNLVPWTDFILFGVRYKIRASLNGVGEMTNG